MFFDDFLSTIKDFAENYIKFDQIEIGSLAEWFSGILTASGILFTLYHSKPRIKIREDITSENFNLTVINDSNFGVDLEILYIRIYEKRFAKKSSKSAELNESFSRDENNNQIPVRYHLEPKRTIPYSLDIINYKQQLEECNATFELNLLRKKKYYIDYAVYYSGRVKKRNRIRINNKESR